MRAIVLSFATMMISQAAASPLAVLDDGAAVVVGTFDGQLQYWKQGAEKPDWAIRMHGQGFGGRSPIFHEEPKPIR